MNTPNPIPANHPPNTASRTYETQTPQQNSLAIGSMILGIISIAGFAGFILGIPAVILGILALKQKSQGRIMSITGIITGAISTTFSLLFLILFLWYAMSSPETIDSNSDLNQDPEYSQPFQPSET